MSKKIHSSARAKRIMPIVLGANIAIFISFVVHACVRGISAFPAGGRLVGDHFIVEDHNRIYEFTHAQYWFSYIHGWVMVGAMFLFFATVLFFYSKGDLSTVIEE